MKEQTDLTKENYAWVWTVRSVRTEKGETVPMEKGDRLYICVADKEHVRFHHRSSRSTKNTELWNETTGTLCEKNTISGKLPDGTQFDMTLARESDYLRITCKHVRNPDQGEWDADDEVTR